MSTDSVARLASLVGYDCWALLEGAEIARVAWVGPSGAAVIPVNYAVADGALWFRLEPGSEAAGQLGGERVVLEVDQINPRTLSGWSVVVVGVAELVEYLDAPHMLVDLRIWPGGSRSLFVRVDAVEVSGRRLFHPEERG